MQRAGIFYGGDVIIAPKTQAVYLIRAHGANLHDDYNENPWSYQNVRSMNHAKMYDIYKVGSTRDLAKRWKQYEAYGFLSHQMAYVKTGHLIRDPNHEANHWENQLRNYIKMYADRCYTRREWYAVDMYDKNGDGSRYYALAHLWTRMRAMRGEPYDNFKKNYLDVHWLTNRHLTEGYKQRHAMYANKSAVWRDIENF